MKNRLILNQNEIIDILGEKYKNFTSVFSDKFGIVNAILERHELDKYKLNMYQCLSEDTRVLFNISRDISSGGLGINSNKKEALTSCIAEALERYCMSYIPVNELIKCKKNEINKKYQFSDFATYSKEQYNNFDKFLDPNKDEIEWVKISDIRNNKKYKYWPASLIYLPYDLNKPVAETTSTGMAAGFTIKECILSGLLELIERDALMINFMQRLDPPEIDIETITGDNRKFIKEIGKVYKIKIYKLYSDIKIPIYMSIIYKGNQKKAHYGIGACASLDSDYAINKSLKECLFTYFYSKNIMNEQQNNTEKIDKLYEHFLYYQGKKFNKLLFDSSVQKYTYEKLSFESLLDNLNENNIQIYYKDLTTCDIKKTGIKVVKVIAPTLIDLNKSHIYPRLGAKRYFEVPKKLGIKHKDKLTNLPHPFP